MTNPIHFTTAEEAVKVIKSGDHVHLSSVASAPQCLINAMCKRGEAGELKDVHVHHLHTEGPAPYADPKFEGVFQLDSFFVGANVRKVTQSGYADYIPIFLSETQRLYLFALGRDGEKLYGREIVPAGVMYVPARSVILPVSRDCGDEEAQRLRLDGVKRSGVVLDDAEVIEAWEHGEDKKYIPIRMRYGKPTPDSLMTAERLGLLSRHIGKTLTDMARQLNSGSIAADPYYRSQQENACLNCDYFDACHFSQGENGESCRFQQKIPADKVIEMMEGEDGNG